MARRLDAGRKPGGTLRLRELAEAHPAEFAYDFRTRFSLSFEQIGRGITWREAVYLVAVMLRDPASHTQAARAGWEYPVSREWITAAHTYDLLARVNAKQKPKPYPNPFPDRSKVKHGSTNRSPAEVRRILAWMNPKEN